MRPLPAALCLSLALLTGWGCRQNNGPAEGSPYPSVGRLEVLDPAFYELVPRDARIERLAGGFNWAEGPLWWPADSVLLFSDVPENTIYAWRPGDTLARPWLVPSGFTGEQSDSPEPGSNGLALGPDGSLLLCQHGDRRVARFLADSSFASVAAGYGGRRFNSPNDLCLGPDGAILFSDPPYGLAQQDADTAKQLAVNGVYRVDKAGRVSLLVGSLSRPNGLALSPDGKRLYVANSDPASARWMVYDYAPDRDSLGEGRLFYDATPLVGQPGEDGLPDGLKVSASGHIFATGPGGVWLFSPDGKVLGKIRTERPTANCALAEGFLYITADDSLLRLRLR